MDVKVNGRRAMVQLSLDVRDWRNLPRPQMRYQMPTRTCATTATATTTIDSHRSTAANSFPCMLIPSTVEPTILHNVVVNDTWPSLIWQCNRPRQPHLGFRIDLQPRPANSLAPLVLTAPSHRAIRLDLSNSLDLHPVVLSIRHSFCFLSA